MLRFFAKRLRDMQEVSRDERGFTLIELLIVIIIIGILAAIAIPIFLAQRDKAVIATCKSDARNAADAAILYSSTTANGDFTGINIAALEGQGFNQTEGYTTVPALNGNNLTITTTCPAPAGGTATWTTTAGAGGAGDFRGEVRYQAAGGGGGGA